MNLLVPSQPNLLYIKIDETPDLDHSLKSAFNWLAVAVDF